MKHLYPLIAVVFLAIALAACQKERSFEIGAPGKGHLQSASGECSPKVVGGTFEAGKPTDNSHYIDLGVLVSGKGSYSIVSDTINGYYFKGTGVYTDTGLVMVRLKAFGTPITGGSDIFTFILDSTLCNVVVPVSGGTTGGPGGSTSYFPLTPNSWWSYDNPTGSADTFRVTNTGTVALANQQYHRFVQVNSGNMPNDTVYYRKDGSGVFYRFIDLSRLAPGQISFSQKVGEIKFLRETLATGDTLNTDFSATVGGLPTVMRFNLTCVNANASVNYNGNPFSNVYQTTLTIQLKTPTGFQNLEVLEFEYARGVGLINTGVDDEEYQIRKWKVN